VEQYGEMNIKTNRIKQFGAWLSLLFLQQVFALNAVKYFGGSHDGHAMSESTPGQILGTVPAAKYSGGSYDGHSMGTSTPGQILGTVLAAKYYGGSYDGVGMGTSTPGQILGALPAAKYYGGSYDGYGSAVSGRVIAKAGQLASLSVTPGNRVVTLSLLADQAAGARYTVLRSMKEEGPYGRVDVESSRDKVGSPLLKYRFTDKSVDNGVTYWYKITALSDDSTETTYGVIAATPDASAPGLPRTFGLSQNFPNPFNPVTEIRYQLPEACRVVISVHDALGRRTAVLVDEDREAGEWSVVWDAGSFATGAYFVRMQAEKFSGVRKMLLVR
jgi:hypothetical protein